MKRIAIIIIGLVFALFSSCRADDSLEDIFNDKDLTDYPDWSEASHSNAVEPNYDKVFNQNEVLRFDIKISDENWSAMQANLDEILGSNSGGFPGGFPGGGPGAQQEMEDPDWFPCSFKFEDKEWYNVGVRYKGNSSLRSAYQSGNNKLSLKLDFDEFENDFPALLDQRFYGFKQLNLNNNYADPSLLREKVGADLFRRFGLISAQTSFCVIYIDSGSGPQYYGVYTLVEEVDDTVVKSQTGDDSGNLYKPEGSAATFAVGTFNEEEMGKKSNESLSDYSDVRELYEVINSAERSSDADSWKSQVQSIFNVDGFMKWLAANTVIQNWDTYGKMNHNYYLYNNVIDGKLNWIPWDNNEAFQNGKMGGALSLSLSEAGDNWPLISYLHNVEEYEHLYDEYLKQFINEVFIPSEMITLYSFYYEMLKEYAYAEESGYTFIRFHSEFDQAIETLKTHVQTRNSDVINYLQ